MSLRQLGQAWFKVDWDELMRFSAFLRCLALADWFLTTGVTKLVQQSPTVLARSVNTARPWTFWWWMGNAVTELTRQLEQFAEGGLGGVHVIPIYGVKG